MRKLAAACGVIGLVALVGCSTLMNPGDDLSRRVDYLRQDVENLTQQQKALTNEVAQLRQQLKKSPAAGTATASVAVPARPAAPVPIEAAPAEPAAPEAPAVKAPESTGERDTANMASDPASRYKKAFGLMEAGKYQAAETAFADFVSKFPQSDLADNAQYWIGECLYAQGHYEDAQAAFKAVSDHFPFGNKVPDALYKQAMCEQKLNRKDEAKKTLEKLRDYYPYSEAAAKAKKLLAQP